MSAFKSTAAAWCAAGCLMLAPPATLAAPILMLQISDGMSTLSVSDQGLGDDDATPGSISFSGTDVFGDWNHVTGSVTAQANPLLLQLRARFDTTPDQLEANDTRRLDFWAAFTELVAGSPAEALTFRTASSGSASDGITGGWQAYADDSDTFRGTASTAGSSAGIGASNGSATLLLEGTYSTTLRAQFDLSAATGTVFSGQQAVSLSLPSNGVPEPATAALVAGGLLLAARRRSRAQG